MGSDEKNNQNTKYTIKKRVNTKNNRNIGIISNFCHFISKNLDIDITEKRLILRIRTRNSIFGTLREFMDQFFHQIFILTFSNLD